MDSIASEGILFEKFYAASPWTAPSFGTILTGVSPAIHRTGKWLEKKETNSTLIGSLFLYPLNSKIKTLPELLEGTQRGAFMTNVFLHKSLGFARGFDYYNYDITRIIGSRRAKKVTELAVKWLTKVKDQNSFTVIHYFDPHTAYEPLPEYKKKFAPGGPVGRIKAPYGPELASLVGFKPTEEEKDHIKHLYNAELRHVDDQIGVLVENMKKLGMLENTWLVITSDHGEEHFDHGWFNHGHRYEDEVTRVPLIIRAPGGKWAAGARVGFSASHVDLFPTILDLFSVSKPKYIEGKSLIPMIIGDDKKNRPCHMEYPLMPRNHYAYFDGRYKIIHLQGNENAKDKEYMYDLKKYPKETVKYNSHHPEFSRMKKEMDTYREGRKKYMDDFDLNEVRNRAYLPQDVKKALESLGYIDQVTDERTVPNIN